MDNLIDRQAAIDAVKKNTFRLTFAEEQNCEGHVAWSAEAVYSDVMEGELLELPSAQPIAKDINVPIKDCISRQAAIDAFKPYADYESNRTNADWVRRIELVLHDLPSAQPEIIRCKNCIKREICRTSTTWAVAPKDDWYCADAERRTDDLQ